MPSDRIENEGEAILHVLHLGRRIFAIPGVDRADAALGVADQERQLAGGDDGEAAGLVAWIDIGEVGDAVARHVVMVESLAELLGRKDLELDGAVRCLLDRCAPFLHRFLQRMRRRDPVRKLEIESLVLRKRGGRADQQAGDRRAPYCKMTLASLRWHRFLLVGNWPLSGLCTHSARSEGHCKVMFAGSRSTIPACACAQFWRMKISI